MCIICGLLEHFETNQKNVKWLLHSFECPCPVQYFISYSLLHSLICLVYSFSWQYTLELKQIHCFAQHSSHWNAPKIQGKREQETEGERAFTVNESIMHGTMQYNAIAVFLFAANKTHYSHILCVIFIECVWAPQLLSFNFQPNSKWAFSHRA